MDPTADESSWSSLDDAAAVLWSALNEGNYQLIHHPHFSRLRLALYQLFTPSGVASLDEDAIVALARAGIVMPVALFRDLDETTEWSFYFLLATVARTRELTDVSVRLRTRSHRVAGKLDAMSPSARAVDVDDQHATPQDRARRIRSAVKHYLYGGRLGGHADLCPESGAGMVRWRHLLDYVLIGRPRVRSRMQAAPEPRDRFDDGVEVVTGHVDMLLNLLGPPPEGSATTSEPDPLVPTGVS